MQINVLRDLADAAPFQPFELRLVSGKRLRVAHPELISISPGGRTAIVWEGEGMAILDVMMVELLEPSRGRRRRQK